MDLGEEGGHKSINVFDSGELRVLIYWQKDMGQKGEKKRKQKETLGGRREDAILLKPKKLGTTRTVNVESRQTRLGGKGGVGSKTLERRSDTLTLRGKE